MHFARRGADQCVLTSPHPQACNPRAGVLPGLQNRGRRAALGARVILFVPSVQRVKMSLIQYVFKEKRVQYQSLLIRETGFFFHRRHPVKVPEISVSSAISC